MNVVVMEATQSDPILIARAEIKAVDEQEIKRVTETIVEVLEVVEKKKRTNFVIVASVGARYCILESQRDAIANFAKKQPDIVSVERPHHQYFVCNTKWDTKITVKFSGESLEVIPIVVDDFEEEFELSQMMAKVAIRATPQRNRNARRRI